MKHALAAAAAFACAIASPAWAGSPLNYDEALNGDLSPNGTVTDLWLDAGLNTVKGQMLVVTHLELPGSPADLDLDAMNLVLPAGLQISGMRVNFTFTDTTQNTLRADWNWQVTAWPSNVTHDNCFVVVGSSPYCASPIFSATGGELMGSLPTNAQRYLIAQGTAMLWNEVTKPVGGSLTYTLSIDVSPVPEPATGLLALLGLPLLARAARTRRA